jgi:hypothetical protein
MNTREIARRIALDCESTYSGVGWSANDTDDLTDAIDSALQQAIADERERAARIIREHRESDKCEGSCWAIITEAIRRDDTGEEGS